MAPKQRPGKEVESSVAAAAPALAMEKPIAGRENLPFFSLFAFKFST